MNRSYLSTFKRLIAAYVIMYIILLVIWPSTFADGTGCTPGQEIQEGCGFGFPTSFIQIAFVSIPLGLFFGSLFSIVYDIVNKHKKK